MRHSWLTKFGAIGLSQLVCCAFRIKYVGVAMSAKACDLLSSNCSLPGTDFLDFFLKKEC